MSGFDPLYDLGSAKTIDNLILELKMIEISFPFPAADPYRASGLFAHLVDSFCNPNNLQYISQSHVFEALLDIFIKVHYSYNFRICTSDAEDEITENRNSWASGRLREVFKKLYKYIENNSKLVLDILDIGGFFFFSHRISGVFSAAMRSHPLTVAYTRRLGGRFLRNAPSIMIRISQCEEAEKQTKKQMSRKPCLYVLAEGDDF